MNTKDSKDSSEDARGPDGLQGRDAWFWPGAVCAAVLAGVAIFQVLVPYSPDPYWSGDPRMQTLEVQITELTPVSYIAMNMGAILVAFAGLVAHRLKGGRLSAWVLVPAAMGVLAALYVGAQDDEAPRMLGWAAAAFGGACAWHLAQRSRERALMVGAVVGICVLLAAKTMMYVLVEFPSGQLFLEQHKWELFQSKGWAPESSQAQAYMRRASQMEATGAYGLSNVFGSLMAALAFLGVGTTFAVARRAGWGRGLLPGLAAIGALMCLAFSFSKGAIVAMAGVAAFAAVAGVVIWKWPRRPAWALPAAAVLLLIGGFGVVIVRGAVVGPPPTIKGERSLLFRYQYWAASARLTQELPAEKWLTGVSQEGFRAAYPRVKSSINPEEVASNHNFWIDYTLMLGIGGLAWSLLLVGWMARGVNEAQRMLSDCETTHVDGLNGARPAVVLRGERQRVRGWYSLIIESAVAAGGDRRGLWAGTLVAVGVFVPVYVLQQPMLLPESLLILMIGLGAMALVMGIVSTGGWVDRRWMGAGLALGGVVLLFHGQIEMTFTTAGAVTLAWLIMALAGSGVGREIGVERNGPGAWLGAIAAVAVMMGAGVWMVTRGMPLIQQQKVLGQAAKALPKDFAQGAGLLRQAVQVYPNSPRPTRNLIDLATEAISAPRQQGVTAEGERARVMSWAVFVEEALAGLPRKVREGHQVVRSESRLRYAQFMAVGDQAVLAEARRLLEQAVAGSPYDRTLREDMARLCEAQGDKAGALAAYEACLKLSEQGYLDETRVYTDAQRAEVEGKVRKLKGE